MKKRIILLIVALFCVVVSHAQTTLEEHKNKYLNDPAYGETYVKYLLDNKMRKEAQSAIEDIFSKQSFDKKITEDKLAYYDQYILTLDSPIIDFLVQNKMDVMRKVGKIAYENFFISRSVKALGVMNAKELNMDDIANALKQYETRPHLQSAYSRYLATHFKYMRNNDYLNLLKGAQKAVLDCYTMERSFITSVILRVVAKNVPDAKCEKELIKFYRICYEKETTLASKERFYTRMQKLIYK